MAKTTLNENGLATQAGNITVYNYDSETREYLSTSVEFLAVGVGIPACSCIDAPIAEKDGFAVCRTLNLDGWEYVTDHRGETVYDKHTGQPVEMTSLGDYPGSMITIAPSTPYDIWNGFAWVTDMDAKNDAVRDSAEQTRQELRVQADSEIAWRQYAVDRGKATAEEAADLIKWQDYRLDLMRIDILNPVWPTPPEV